MATWTQDAVDALATAVSERRRYLGRSQIDVWRNGGPANSTMTSLESAASLSVTPSTLRKLDAGLSWAPDTAARVIGGEIVPATAVRDPRFDARPTADIGATGFGEADEAVSLDDAAAVVAALAVDADDIASITRTLDTSVAIDDPHAVEAFVSRVEDVIGDIDDFVEAVGVAARRVFGGDTERLRRTKRATKRFRRQQSAIRALPALMMDDDVTPPIAEPLRAARTAPLGYPAGRSGQGEADGEGSQDR